MKLTIALTRKELGACPDAALTALAEAWRDAADGSRLEALLWKQIAGTPAETFAGVRFKLQLALSTLKPSRTLLKSALSDLEHWDRKPPARGPRP
jgi:hypothetical protein